MSSSAYSALDDLVEPAQTQQITYVCSCGHNFSLRLFAEAETIPLSWDCPTCGAKARTETPEAQEIPVPRRAGSPSKTPWQQLLERRSIADLEIILEERLALLRATVAASSAESADGPVEAA